MTVSYLHEEVLVPRDLVVLLHHGDEERRLRAAGVVDPVPVRDQPDRVHQVGKVLQHAWKTEENFFCHTSHVEKFNFKI